MTELVPVVIDGTEVEVERGTALIEACKRVGFKVPHYCYHKALSISGNCRMCLVTIEQFPKPMTACTVRVDWHRTRDGKSEPLRVITQSEALAEIRASIMEFLLINHPLDCPQCDQAGECQLQDYAYTFGHDRSRFSEAKVIKHTKELGPTVSLWGNRCIACARCTRFCAEIAGTGELTLVNRGDRNVIDIFPGIPLDNPLSLNTVDLCPVGALLSRDFLFRSRSWNLEAAPTVCGACAKGCNVLVESDRGAIVRQRPRSNADVNQWWMCDRGRLSYRWVGEHRLTEARLERQPAPLAKVVAATRARLAALADEGQLQRSALVLSAWMTNEELFLARELFGPNGRFPIASVVRRVAPDGEPWTAANGWQIPADRNPNRAGLEAIWGPGRWVDSLDALTEEIERDAIKHVVLVADIPERPVEDALVEAVGKLETLVVLARWDTPITKRASHVLPGVAWFEKRGTAVNAGGRVQRLVPAPRLKRQGDATEDATLYQWLAAAGTGASGLGDGDAASFAASAGARDGAVRSASAVFARLAEAHAAFAGLEAHEIGRLGAPLAGAATPA